MRYLLDIATDSGWQSAGSILLPQKAPAGLVARSLEALGIYVPRGLDVLRWWDGRRGFVVDACGTPIVRFQAVDGSKKTQGKGVQ